MTGRESVETSAEVFEKVDMTKKPSSRNVHLTERPGLMADAAQHGCVDVQPSS